MAGSYCFFTQTSKSEFSLPMGWTHSAGIPDGQQGETFHPAAAWKLKETSLPTFCRSRCIKVIHSNQSSPISGIHLATTQFILQFLPDVLTLGQFPPHVFILGQIKLSIKDKQKGGGVCWRQGERIFTQKPGYLLLGRIYCISQHLPQKINDMYVQHATTLNSPNQSLH